ncbi:MAG: hypothetical protein DRO43_06770 [Candidatus Hecatellales archaeon]|nr:MAG: hypothetical protein DRO43_06770 [Candidatus Hecatellales archaeon]
MYALWWNRTLGRLILNRILPALRWEIYPPFLEIEPTTVCNLKCVMCEHTYWSEPPRNMTFEEFKAIVDQFPRLKWLGLTGIGSSFLNKDYLRMIKYVKSRGVLVEIVDTFNHVDEETLRELIGIEPDILFVSVYGATKETYEKVCVGGNFSRVMQNIETFVKLKKEMKTLLPVLNFHYIVSRLNLGEVASFLKFVQDLDSEVGEVLITPLLHSFKEVEGLRVELDGRQIDFFKREAERLGVRLDYNVAVPRGERAPVNHCVEWIMPFIFVTGHVIPCCAENEANAREFQKKTSMGNVFKQSFREIWYGEKYRSLRKMLREGKVPPPCVNCPIYRVESFKA